MNANPFASVSESLRYHVSGAIERGEAVAIAARPAVVTVHAADGAHAAPYSTHGKPQPRRGKVSACRFRVLYRGRWRRLYSDHTPGLSVPHFIRVDGARVPVSSVAP